MIPQKPSSSSTLYTSGSTGALNDNSAIKIYREEKEAFPAGYIDKNSAILPFIRVTAAQTTSFMGEFLAAFNRANTCKATEDFKAYLTGILTQIQKFEDALEHDKIIDSSTDQQRKQLLTEQISVLKPLIRALIEHPALRKIPGGGSLSPTEIFGKIPQVFAALIEEADSNMYSAIIHPGNLDSYSNTYNKICTVDRNSNGFLYTHLTSFFRESLGGYGLCKAGPDVPPSNNMVYLKINEQNNATIEYASSPGGPFSPLVVSPTDTTLNTTQLLSLRQLIRNDQLYRMNEAVKKALLQKIFAGSPGRQGGIVPPNWNGKTKKDFTDHILAQCNTLTLSTYEKFLTDVLTFCKTLYAARYPGKTNVFELSPETVKNIQDAVTRSHGDPTDNIESYEIGTVVNTIINRVFESDTQALEDDQLEEFFYPVSLCSPFTKFRFKRAKSDSAAATYTQEQILSSFVQSFLAMYNIFATDLKILSSKTNFASKLETERDQGHKDRLIANLKAKIRAAMSASHFADPQNTLVEQAICEFIEENASFFGLRRALSSGEAGEKKKLIEAFRQFWLVTFHAPHWDEIVITLPKESGKNRSFIVQDSSSWPLVEVAERLITTSEPSTQTSLLNTALQNYKRKMGELHLSYDSTTIPTVLSSRDKPLAPTLLLSLGEIKKKIKEAVRSSNSEALGILIRKVSDQQGKSFVFDCLDDGFFIELNREFPHAAGLLRALLNKLPDSRPKQTTPGVEAKSPVMRFKEKVLLEESGVEYLFLSNEDEEKLRAAVQHCQELSVQEVYQPFSANSVGFYLNKLHELSSSSDRATQRHCADYGNVNTLAVFPSHSDANKCILKGPPEQVGKVRNILQHYDDKIFINTRQASAIYKAVIDRFGLESEEYKYMMAIGNNERDGGIPHRMLRALEVLEFPIKDVEVGTSNHSDLEITYNNVINSKEFESKTNYSNGQPKRGGSGFIMTIRRGDPKAFRKKIKEFENAHANTFTLDQADIAALLKAVDKFVPGLLQDPQYANMAADAKVRIAFQLLGIQHRGIYPSRQASSANSVLVFCDYLKYQGILKHMLILGDLDPDPKRNKYPINNEDRQCLGLNPAAGYRGPLDYKPTILQGRVRDLRNLNAVKAMLAEIENTPVAQESLEPGSAENSSVSYTTLTLSKRDAFALYTALLDRACIHPDRIGKFFSYEDLRQNLVDLQSFYGFETSNISQLRESPLEGRATANISAPEENTDKIVLRLPQETQAKLTTIIQEYQRTFYISMAMVIPLYQEVERRYGKDSFACRFMNGLNNNISGHYVPYKFICALILLGIDIPLSSIRINNTLSGSSQWGGQGFILSDIREQDFKMIEDIAANAQYSYLSMDMLLHLENLFVYDRNLITGCSSDLKQIYLYLGQQIMNAPGATISDHETRATRLRAMLSLLGIEYSSLTSESLPGDTTGQKDHFKIQIPREELTKLKHVLRSIPMRVPELYSNNMLNAFTKEEFLQLKRNFNNLLFLNLANEDNYRQIGFTEKQAQALRWALGPQHPFYSRIPASFVDESDPLVLWNKEDDGHLETYQKKYHENYTVKLQEPKPMKEASSPLSPVASYNRLISSAAPVNRTIMPSEEELFHRACDVVTRLASYAQNNPTVKQSHHKIKEKTVDANNNSLPVKNSSTRNDYYYIPLVKGPGGNTGMHYTNNDPSKAYKTNYTIWFSDLKSEPPLASSIQNNHAGLKPSAVNRTTRGVSSQTTVPSSINSQGTGGNWPPVSPLATSGMSNTGNNNYGYHPLGHYSSSSNQPQSSINQTNNPLNQPFNTNSSLQSGRENSNNPRPAAPSSQGNQSAIPLSNTNRNSGNNSNNTQSRTVAPITSNVAPMSHSLPGGLSGNNRPAASQASYFTTEQQRLIKDILQQSTKKRSWFIGQWDNKKHELEGKRNNAGLLLAGSQTVAEGALREFAEKANQYRSSNQPKEGATKTFLFFKKELEKVDPNLANRVTQGVQCKPFEKDRPRR